MGALITEQKIANYDMLTFEGMLLSIENIQVEEVGQQGNLKQWRVKMAGEWNLPLGYVTARQIGRVLILRFYRMEWERQENYSENEDITKYYAQLNEEGWIRVGHTDAWNNIMIEEISNAVRQELEYINEQIKNSLELLVPLHLKNNLGTFSEWLGRIVQLALSKDESNQNYEVDNNIFELLQALTGRQIGLGGSTITFGEGNQIGDVKIGDIASGHIIKITIHNYYSDKNNTSMSKINYAS